MRVPTKSAGKRSGVNWMRLKVALRRVARVFTARVLARPGRPSSSTCPPVSRPSRRLSIISCCPTTTLEASSKSACRLSCSSLARPLSFLVSLAIFNSLGSRRRFQKRRQFLQVFVELLNIEFFRHRLGQHQNSGPRRGRGPQLLHGPLQAALESLLAQGLFPRVEVALQDYFHALEARPRLGVFLFHFIEGGREK